MSNLSIHYPRRSAAKAAIALTPWPAPIPPQWQRMAQQKGFTVTDRVGDRYHVLLRCRDCGGLTMAKAYTLRTAQPKCAACGDRALRDTAAAARLTFLRRDAEDRHYAVYRAPCGHEVRRQLELVQRIAAGKVQVRCETCFQAEVAAEAIAQGWQLLGPDPDGHDGYRLYRHGCGHEQRVARVNMRTGRFACAGCDAGWAAEPNRIYLMRLDLEGVGVVVKLGHSRLPLSRMRYQLGLDPERRQELIHEVRMPSGHEALRVERGMHARLLREIPDLVVPREALEAARINVTREIYRAEAEPRLRSLLDDLEDAIGTGS
ncbi:GIY-YIG nuclease family protein [Pseudoroseicyclus aestuarii]|uniref:Uncharacterized protein n=1 Tax=Pseudoroseicyclus aestuarii TaxID=1795041 RepID=A0A318SMF8_9RHOB|nr:GIY-YIG nuclease family protein [Pseudoroseicyclus aestuarii]PYE80865.1 hypothetical protein DFP88_11029 [Pseudoroseicyclus aestuarii]